MLFIALKQWIAELGLGHFLLEQPQYWVYPLQTITCGALIARYWRHYALRFPSHLLFTTAIGILVLVLWISPQAFLHFPPRLDGFNPTVFAAGSALYWTSLLFRFIRMTLVVPLVEEVFWRGFLLRYFVREDFESVPFGTFTWVSFSAVSVGFALEHTMADWPAALITGALYNWVAIRTRSLSACVLAHAVTNLLLGLWIMKTGQWGFW